MAKLLKKLALLITLLSSFTIAAIAQDVTLSATVHDPSGQAFQWGTYTITFAPNPSSPTPPSGYSIGGNPALPVNLGPYKGELDINGTLNTTLINGDNSLLAPGGSKWLVQVCPDVQAGGGTTSPCTQLYIALAGTQDISTQLNATTLPIGIFGLQPMATAYSDSEVEAHLDGTFYFRVVDRVVRCWSQGSFYDCLGGGGGSLSVQHNTVLVGTEPAINLDDTGTVIFTVTDDPGDTRINISAAASGGTATTYQHNNVDVASEPKLNLIDNGSVVYTVTDDPGSTRVNVEATASGGTGDVFCEFLYPLMDCNAPIAGGVPTNDIQRVLFNQNGSYPFIGPLPYTNPLSLLVQDSINNDATQIADISLPFGGVVSPGNVLYCIGDTADGLGYFDTITFTSSLGNVFTPLDFWTNPQVPSANAWAPITVGGNEVITMHVSNPLGGINATTEGHCMELRNISGVDAHSTCNGGGCPGGIAGPSYTMSPVTTTHANDVIISTLIGTQAGVPISDPYVAGAGYGLINQIFTHNSNVYASLATISTDVSSTGTYTPLISNASSPFNVNEFTVAFKYTGSLTSAPPTFRKTIVADQVTQGWFPDPTGKNNFILATPDGKVLAWVHHTVVGNCILGTDCAVTLTGTDVFTSSSSYVCIAQDQTAIAATKVAQSSGAAFTITGTGTDHIGYSCSGS